VAQPCSLPLAELLHRVQPAVKKGGKFIFCALSQCAVMFKARPVAPREFVACGLTARCMQAADVQHVAGMLLMHIYSMFR